MTKILSPEELEQELRAIGAERYHDKHPFHKLLHGGTPATGSDAHLLTQGPRKRPDARADRSQLRRRTAGQGLSPPAHIP